MRSHLAQLALTFALTVLIDLVAGLHVKTLIASEMGMAIASVMAAHYLTFATWVFWVDEKSNWRRFWLTTAAALGAAAGTAILLMAT